MDVREDRHYTEEHEWIQPAGDTAVRVGISDYAQDQLGDIVFVALPEIGTEFAKGDTMAEVESTKSVGEVYAPMAGTVTEVNAALVDRPELINQDAFGEGWIVVIDVGEALSPEGLLDAEAYKALTE